MSMSVIRLLGVTQSRHRLVIAYGRTRTDPGCCIGSFCLAYVPQCVNLRYTQPAIAHVPQHQAMLLST